MTPALTAFPLRRAGDLSLLLDGEFTSPESFEVGPGPDSLLCDNGASTCVAGRDWARCLFHLPGIERHLRGVGGVQLRSTGRGRISLHFPDGAHLRWLSAPGFSLLTGKKCELKKARPGGHLAAPRAPLLLQGLMLIWAEPPVGPTEEGDSLAAAVTEAADAVAAPPVPPGVAVPGSALANLLQRPELPVPGLAVRPSARRSCRFSALTQGQVANRLHITQPPVLRELYRMALGVGRFSPPHGAQLVPGHLIQASLRRRAAPAVRALGSRALSASLPVGKRWHVDMLSHLPPCLSGFVTGALFVEDRTSLLKLLPMRSGTAVEFGGVLDRHAVWMPSAHLLLLGLLPLPRPLLSSIIIHTHNS